MNKTHVLARDIIGVVGKGRVRIGTQAGPVFVYYFRNVSISVNPMRRWTRQTRRWTRHLLRRTDTGLCETLCRRHVTWAPPGKGHTDDNGDTIVKAKARECRTCVRQLKKLPPAQIAKYIAHKIRYSA